MKIGYIVGVLLSTAVVLCLMVLALPSQAQGCQFVLGFATIQQQIPQIVGNCVTNEIHDEAGNANQMTTNGMMQWRKSDNFTAFTDGYRSWVNGPCGLEVRLNTQRFPWEANPTGLQVVPSACNAPVAIVPPIAILPPNEIPTPLPAPIIEFTVDANPIRQGECTRIRWNVQNIDQVFFQGEGVVGQDSRRVCPTQNTTYTLDVVLVDGNVESRRINLRVNPPAEPRIEFFANDLAIFAGNCTTLNWSTSNIDSVFLDGQGVPGNGARQVCPTQTTTYELEVRLRNNAGIERHQVDVVVLPVP
ncbi:MAG: hypothetical protein U0822_02865 [Anaerolineae bacterium]